MVRKILLCIFACTFVMSEAQEESVRPYQLPDIPDSLVTPDVRSEYLIAHYWDNFDIENRAYLDAREIPEQAFVDFTSIMRIASRESTLKSCSGQGTERRRKSSLFFVFLKKRA